MTIRIDSMYMAPVKSLALVPVTRARLDKPGIAGDRAFFLIDERGRLLTQREHGPLVQLTASYDPQSGELGLLFPDGGDVTGVPEPGDGVTTSFFGEREVEGNVVHGAWNDALSAFAGRPVRLVKARAPGSSFDGFPLSMCGAASVQAVADAAGVAAVDGRRFRQNIYITGGAPHAEDGWLGKEVAVGNAVLRVKMRDPRCAVTTHSPETGEIDMNTLKIIASYRTDQPKEVNFGVYCTVAQPGDVAVGDEVVPPSA